MEEYRYEKRYKNVFDEEGKCPICCEEVKYSMTLPCCKYQICSECFIRFNMKKDDLKCTYCNTNINKFYIVDELIDEINRNEITFNYFLGEIFSYKIELKKENLERINMERLIDREDHILVAIVQNSNYRKYFEIVYEHIKSIIDWKLKVETIILTERVTSPLILFVLWYIWNNILRNEIMSMNEEDIRECRSDGISYLESISYFEGMDNECFEYVLNKSPKYFYNNKIFLNLMKNGKMKYLDEVYDNIGKLTPYDKNLCLFYALRSNNDEYVKRIIENRFIKIKVEYKYEPLIMLISDMNIFINCNIKVEINRKEISVFEYLVNVSDLSYLGNPGYDYRDKITLIYKNFVKFWINKKLEYIELLERNKTLMKLLK